MPEHLGVELSRRESIKREGGVGELFALGALASPAFAASPAPGDGEMADAIYHRGPILTLGEGPATGPRH